MKKEKTMNENENPNVNEEPVVAPAPQPQTEAPVYASPIPEEPVKKKSKGAKKFGEMLNAVYICNAEEQDTNV